MRSRAIQTLGTGELTEKARWVRRELLEMCLATNAGHLASSLSCADILVALYYGGILRFDAAAPDWVERDRFIISKGHGALSLYPILADLGFFPAAELASFCGPSSRLGVHPDFEIPGIEATTGSLGHGLGIASGLALSARLDGRPRLNVALLGDGECQEGAVWEAALFAAQHRLSNLVAIVDRNGLSVTDHTENYLSLDPLGGKWHAFGWQVKTVSGHAFPELLGALGGLRRRRAKRPLVIIAETVKGKGVSFMEGRPEWHTRVPQGDDIARARAELAVNHRG